MSAVIRATASTTQPADAHDGVVSHYPRPAGSGWQFVAFDDNDVTVRYRWERTVQVPAVLLVTRDQQDANDDEVTTLRSDARYLRGLACGTPTEDDAAALRKIAGKLDALADVVLPEVGTDAKGNVQSWRDVSGSGRDATQSYPAKMPSR